MKNIRAIFAAILCVGCVLVTGCGKQDTKDVQADAEKNVTVEDGEKQKEQDMPAASDENTDEDNESEENPDSEQTEDVEPAVFINKLTGLETTEELANTRPVAIMINNLKAALPQQGITEADIMYEVLAEGGITRLLCLYTDYASLPETGSVRSSRDYYIDLADAHDAIYVHCGTSPKAKEVLAARNTDNMDGIYFDTPFYRNQQRWKDMGQEHSLMTTGELLVEGISQKGYRTTSDAEQPLSFNAFDSLLGTGKGAKYVKLVFSTYQTVELEYDEESGVYMKKQYGKPHIDANNGEQLTFENVMILYCNQGVISGDDAGRLYVNFYGSGDGYYMSNGEYKKIKWYKESRTSTYTLYEEDGVTEVLLNPGKSYIAIAPPYAQTVIE